MSDRTTEPAFADPATAQVSRPSAEPLPWKGPVGEENTRLLLVVHAESIYRRYGPDVAVDSGLSARGWEQASALARWLAQYETVHHLVSGPQLRSRLTAQSIGQALGLPVVEAPHLPSADLPFPHEPTAETLDALLGQMDLEALHQALSSILRGHGGQTVALVTSPVTVAGILRLLAESPRTRFWIEHATISELCLCHGAWYLRGLNRREHLPHVPRAPLPEMLSDRTSQEEVEELQAIRRLYNRVAQIHPPLPEPEHEKVIGEIALHMLEGQERGRVLVVGSGLGWLVQHLAGRPFREVLGVDVSPMMLERAELDRLRLQDAERAARMGFRLAAAQDLPFAEQTFDWAVLPLLLHHTRGAERILAEARRVLRPGGKLLLIEIAAPEDPVHRATHNAIEGRRNPTHVAIRSAEEWHSRLGALGFLVERERMVSVEYRVDRWLDELAVDEETRDAVCTMLEASMETDAAGLHVRLRNGELVFEKQLVFLRAVR